MMMVMMMCVTLVCFCVFSAQNGPFHRGEG